MQRIRFTVIILMAIIKVFGQDSTYLSPGILNPILPGYFADPTVKKFGDTFYIYATTDGIMFGSGEPIVWVSTDFVNWTCIELDLEYHTSTVWAPDVVQGPDGRYYYYYSNCDDGCNIYGYVAVNPIGPWKPLNNDFSPVVPDRLVPDVISLDGQIMKDAQNNYWIYFCTWAMNRNSGMGWAKMNPDMKSFSASGKIPNTQLKGVFEGSFVFEKDNKFYATYSAGWCHDETYRVQYGVSDSPNGEFIFGMNNPVLSSSADLTVHGPGHHSVLKNNNDYYIIYHRHDNPQSTGGMFRQVCADRLEFADNEIQKVKPTHAGIGYLGENQIKVPNKAYTKKVSASGFYKLPTNGFEFKPGFAVDDNNGTQWKAADVSMGQWIEIDLGEQTDIYQIMTQFEYATLYYQYKIEVSADEKTWNLFADRLNNRIAGSPMVDKGNAKARFVKLTITGTEKPGMFAAIWNIKVFDREPAFKSFVNKPSSEGPAAIYLPSVIVDFDATTQTLGEVKTIDNKGSIHGIFTSNGLKPVTIKEIYGIKAAVFDSNYLALDVRCPVSLSWNQPFTYSAWVINPTIGNGECVFKWTDRTGIMATYAATYYGKSKDYGAVAHWSYPDMGFNGGVPDENKWHHMVITFDGMVESVYVDGKLNATEQKNLFIIPGGEIAIGYSGEPSEYFSGAVARITLQNKYATPGEVDSLFKTEQLTPDYSKVGF